MRLVNILAFLSTLFFLSTLGCSNSPLAGGDQGGATIEVVALQGIARHDDGSPAAEASVYVRPLDYLVDTVRVDCLVAPDTRADSGGHFQVDSLPPAGTYRLEVIDADGHRGFSGLVETPAPYEPAESGPVDTFTLQSMVPVTGTVKAPLPASVYIRIIGTEHGTRADSLTGAFHFPALPPGTYQFQVSTSQPQLGTYLTREVPVAESTQLDTAILVPWEEESLANWPHSVLLEWPKLSQLQQTVPSPVLLVRLDSTNFDFAEASLQGDDIRFSTLGGRQLAFHREHWSRTRKTAAFWVRIDSLGPDPIHPAIRMYWGREGVASRSAPSLVFPRGYAAVWNLSEAATGKSGEFPSLTDGIAGTGGGGSTDRLPQWIPGIAGNAQRFDGVNDYISVYHEGALHPTGPFTVSAWVKLSRLSRENPYQWQTICRQKHGVQPHLSYELCQQIVEGKEAFVFRCAQTDQQTIDALAIPQGGIVADRWYHLTGVFTGSSVCLYVDGVETHSPRIFSGTMLRGDGLFHIGAATESIRRLAGSVDEVRISTSARTREWAQLQYATQRPGAGPVFVVQQ
jgi:hypothetical protein